MGNGGFYFIGYLLRFKSEGGEGEKRFKSENKKDNYWQICPRFLKLYYEYLCKLHF